MINNITFLSNDAPLKSKGSGISVLLYNIIDALKGNYIVSSLTFCKDSNANCETILADNKDININILDDRLEKIYPKLRFGKIKQLFQILNYIIKIPKIRKVNNIRDNLIVTVVGISVIPVINAWLLMKFLGKARHGLYIVDDLELINRIQKNKFELFLIKTFLGRTIKKTDVFINISKGLRDLYLQQYGKDSLVLPPHFAKKDLLKNAVNEEEFSFIFTGGLNLLYNESLQLFAKAIEYLNHNSTNIIYKLVIQTYSPKTEFDKLAFNVQYVTYSTTDNRAELYKIYEECDCFLVPYSFAENDKGMVVTSFPQKIAEIIQYGKKILIFGPSYSSVNNFFNEKLLSFTCEHADIALLISKIKEVKETKVEVTKYIRAYEDNLSAQAVLNLFDECKRLIK